MFESRFSFASNLIVVNVAYIRGLEEKVSAHDPVTQYLPSHTHSNSFHSSFPFHIAYGESSLFCIAYISFNEMATYTFIASTSSYFFYTVFRSYLHGRPGWHVHLALAS